jgi:3-methyladenine DNA glycosylase Mpg
MSYVVRCQSASGRVVDVHVYAGTDNEACRAALRELPSDYRAVYALQS